MERKREKMERLCTVEDIIKREEELGGRSIWSRQQAFNQQICCIETKLDIGGDDARDYILRML